MINLNKSLFSSQRNNYLPSIRFFSKRVSSSYFLPKISRFINKYLYRFGLGSSLNRYDNSFSIFSSNADKILYSTFTSKETFINFGSGAFFHNRWKNYDFPGNSKYYKNLQGIEGKDFHGINLCNPLLTVPEKDDSVSLIYCSHTLEHLDLKSSTRFLKECFRILRPNGVLRVALPNTKNDFYLYRCLVDQTSDIDIIKTNYMRDVAEHILSDTKNLKTHVINDLLKSSQNDSNKFVKNLMQEHKSLFEFKASNPERHINYWDFETLINSVLNVGFKNCIPAYQGSSVVLPFSNLNVFDNTEPHIAFYADIIK